MVAEEVKTLVMRTQQSIEEIRSLLNQLQIVPNDASSHKASLLSSGLPDNMTVQEALVVQFRC